MITGCEVLPDREASKNIIITDIDPVYQVQIHALTDEQRIILVLWDAATQPNPNEIRSDQLLKMPFSIGKIQNGVINVRLSEQLDWWTGTGNYWILFLLVDQRGEKAYSGYISKEPHYINEKTTRIYNKDFMLPVTLNLDLSGVF
jgi:hypothetical protein